MSRPETCTVKVPVLVRSHPSSRVILGSPTPHLLVPFRTRLRSLVPTGPLLYPAPPLRRVPWPRFHVTVMSGFRVSTRPRSLCPSSPEGSPPTGGLSFRSVPVVSTYPLPGPTDTLYFHLPCAALSPSESPESPREEGSLCRGGRVRTESWSRDGPPLPPKVRILRVPLALNRAQYVLRGREGSVGVKTLKCRGLRPRVSGVGGVLIGDPLVRPR